jgi:ribonuclease-3
VDMKSIMVDNNYKDHLMRYTQSNNLPLPDYRVTSQIDGVFTVDVFVDNIFLGRGFAKSKKRAEQNAAKAFFYPPQLKR